MKRGLVALGFALAVWGAAWPVSAYSEKDLILSQVSTVLRAPYRLGAEGPSSFDCSGLVWYVFDRSGLGDRIGGKRMIAREYQRWMRSRGLLFTDRRKVQVGDLAFYGSPAKHIGIVTSIDRKGRPRVTSALLGWGVAEVRWDLLEKVPAFSSWGHPSLVEVPDPPSPSPTPSPTPSIEVPPSPDPSVAPTPYPEPTSTPIVVYQ